MASIDYQEARKEIINIFGKDTGERKIVFWYDAPQNFKSDILSDSFDCCKLLICDRNEFAVKKTLEHDDPASNYLVYIPYEKPVHTENWLLDILMYSEEYFADTVALTMRRLGITNTDLRRVIERHIKFFDSEGRIKKLSGFIEVTDTMDSRAFRIAMMSVLCKAAAPSVESVLTELVFDQSQGAKYNELKKFGFEEFLWNEIAEAYNYSGEQSISSLTKQFLFTAFLEQKTELEDLPSFYAQFTIAGPGKMDAKFFVDKIKTDKRYPALQGTMAEELRIAGLLSGRDIESIQTADIFECIDCHIISFIANGLKNGSLDYETFERIIANRYNSMWYGKHEDEYSVLSSAISFFRCVEKPIIPGLSAGEYIQNYVSGYYLIDTYYRRACASYKKIECPSAEFEWLMIRLEQSYQTNFLDVLGPAYSDALAKQSAWSFPGSEMTEDFYLSIQRCNFKKLFIIISDGFRYEVGHELYEQLRTDPILKGSAEIDYAISPLPSETRFGMAALLPHRSTQYEEKMVSVDGMPTNTIAARNAVLQARNKSYSAISYDDINNMLRSDLRNYMADKSVVFIYHNVVDNAGEHAPHTVFDMVPKAVNEIQMLIRKLFSSLQISNFYVTADHGFLYRSNTVEESMKYSNVLAMQPTEASKRYVLTDNNDIAIPYTNEYKLGNVSDGQYRVITPYGYDLFKTQGSGLQYIHGGASLQETVVPVIRLGEMRSSRSKESTSPVGVRLKSVTRKITNRSFTLEFEQYEKVEERKIAITCDTYLVDENNEKVSGEYRFIANASGDDPESRITKIRFALKNIEFDRNKRYYLILRDISKPTEYMEKEQFTIDILSFKMF